MARSLSNRLWGYLSRSQIVLAVSELRLAMPHADPDLVLIWTHVVAATPHNGDRDMRWMAHQFRRGGGRSPARALETVINLSRAIEVEDWYRAARHVGSIRHYAPATSRVTLVGLLGAIDRNRNGNLPTPGWMMDRLYDLTA